MGGAEMRKKDDIMEPTFVVRDRMLADKEYVEWLADLKRRFLYSQAKAAVRVNTAMLEYYWSLGRDITQIQAESKWGSGFFNQLSHDMRTMFPNETGFSVTNLKYMKRWYLFYYERVIKCQRPVDQIGHQAGDQFEDIEKSHQLDGQINNPKTGQQVADQLDESEKGQQLVDQLQFPDSFGLIPWGCHILIFSKCQTLDEAIFYINKVTEEGWSRSRLESQMAANLFGSQGAAVTNFEHTLPAPQSQLAKEILKDPYHFGFLSMSEEYEEKDLEDALVSNVTRFLMELGKGFSYVGRQMELQMPGGQTFFPDLLFYHIPQHRYVVIELKVVKYIPEFAGKLNFYVTAVDELLRGEGDNPTVGLIICKSTDKTVVEWSLRDINKPLGVSSYQLEQVVERTVRELELKKENSRK
jgi:predicted nuclease of restriction endonuclease-like (RecB) superfamily